MRAHPRRKEAFPARVTVGWEWDMEGQCWSLHPLPTTGSASAPVQPQAFNVVLTQVSSSNGSETYVTGHRGGGRESLL